MSIKKVSFIHTLHLMYYIIPEAKFYNAGENLFISSNDHFVFLEYFVEDYLYTVAVPMSNVQQIFFEPEKETPQPEKETPQPEKKSKKDKLTQN